MSLDLAWQQMAEEGKLDGFPVILLAETASTNEEAIAQARKGAKAYSVVVAETQSAGRGRLGKSWQSPVGTGLYFSVVLRPALSPEDVPKITLAAGLAGSTALEASTGLTIGIKWPNDLVLDGRKLGGILCEATELEGDSRPVVVLGIGLNINSPKNVFPDELQDKATSLLIATGREHCRSALLLSILRELKKTITIFERDGFEKILAAWRQRDVTLGHELSWLTLAGDIVRGVSLGPDNSGQLLIKDKDGRIHEVLSGDINLVSKS